MACSAFWSSSAFELVERASRSVCTSDDKKDQMRATDDSSNLVVVMVTNVVPTRWAPVMDPRSRPAIDAVFPSCDDTAFFNTP